MVVQAAALKVGKGIAKKAVRRKKQSFKTAAAHREMKRLNPHIENQFIDSPIVSTSGLAGHLTGNLLGVLLGNSALKRESMKTSFRIGTIVMNWFIFGQLPLYILFFSLFAISLIFGLAMTPGESLAEWTGIELLTSINDVTGLSIGMGLTQGLSIGFSAIITGISWSIMLFACIFYSKNKIHWFNGEYHMLKVIFFLLAIVGYSLTFFQFLPWALPWILVVAFNPE